MYRLVHFQKAVLVIFLQLLGISYPAVVTTVATTAPDSVKVTSFTTSQATINNLDVMITSNIYSETVFQATENSLTSYENSMTLTKKASTSSDAQPLQAMLWDALTLAVAVMLVAMEMYHVGLHGYEDAPCKGLVKRRKYVLKSFYMSMPSGLRLLTTCLAMSIYSLIYSRIRYSYNDTVLDFNWTIFAFVLPIFVAVNDGNVLVSAVTSLIALACTAFCPLIVFGISLNIVSFYSLCSGGICLIIGLLLKPPNVCCPNKHSNIFTKICGLLIALPLAEFAALNAAACVENSSSKMLSDILPDNICQTAQSWNTIELVIYSVICASVIVFYPLHVVTSCHYSDKKETLPYYLLHVGSFLIINLQTVSVATSRCHESRSAQFMIAIYIFDITALIFVFCSCFHCYVVGLTFSKHLSRRKQTACWVMITREPGRVRNHIIDVTSGESTNNIEHEQEEAREALREEQSEEVDSRGVMLTSSAII